MESKSISQLMDLSGKTAIITGGAMGIGLGITTRLAEAGASVMIADFNGQAATESAQNLADKGYKAGQVRVDVSDENQVKEMVESTIAKFGGLDILVNNAGIFPTIPLSQMTSQDFEKVIDTNLKGVFLCTKYASQQMKKQGKGGKIINITSIDAIHPSSVGLAHYDASKHGVWGFTKNVALELAQDKIWVNAIAPGGISTPGVAKMQQPGSNEMIESFLAKIPMHRMGEPDEIGKVALFLASDLSSYMTGSQIVVDGGALLA